MSKAVAVENAGWEVVGNAKRDKYQARKASKKAAEEAAAAPAEVVVEKAKAAPVEDAPAESSNKSAKSKSKAKKPTTLSISNDQDMIKALQQVLSQAPVGFLLASVVSERLQVLTGQAWNKKFKTQFGPMITFIKAHPDAFHVVDDSKVFDIVAWNKLNGIVAPKKGGKQDKNAKAAPAPAPAHTEAKAPAAPAKAQAQAPKTQQQPAKSHSKNNRKQNQQQEKPAAAAPFGVMQLAIVAAVLAAGFAYFTLQR